LRTLKVISNTRQSPQPCLSYECSAVGRDISQERLSLG
jgi:hypothetical protein